MLAVFKMDLVKGAANHRVGIVGTQHNGLSPVLRPQPG